jgi:hypothetical protein
MKPEELARGGKAREPLSLVAQQLPHLNAG